MPGPIALHYLLTHNTSKQLNQMFFILDYQYINAMFISICNVVAIIDLD